MMNSIICASCHKENMLGVNVCTSCQMDPSIAQRYVLRRVLGAGAVGTTYLADDLTHGRRVAVKELSVRSIHSMKALELFEREVSVLRSIQHPGVPRYFDHFDEADGKYVSMFLVQEFIDGHTLDQELEHKRFTEVEVLDVIRQITLILIDLHQTNPPIVHRDIKPKNVMRRPDGRLVLIDFGSVREVLHNADVGGSTVAGTFGFMAPEQFAGMAQPASDLYALGVLAVMLLCRRGPQALLDANNRLIWRPHVPNVSPHMMHILEQMLQPSMERRVQSAQELLALVEAPPQTNALVPVRTSPQASDGEHIYNILCARFQQMHPGIPIDNMMASRLSSSSDLASIMLGREPQVDIDLPFFTATASGPIHFKTVLRREDLHGQGSQMVHQSNHQGNYPIVKSSPKKAVMGIVIAVVIFTGLTTILPIFFILVAMFL